MNGELVLQVLVSIHLFCGHSQWWYWGYFLLEIKARYLRMCLSERACVGKWTSLCVHARERERERERLCVRAALSAIQVMELSFPSPLCLPLTHMLSHAHTLTCTHTLFLSCTEACSIFKHFIFYCANSVCFTLGLKQNLQNMPHHDNRYSCWNKISQMLSWFHSMNSLQNTWAATPNEQSGMAGVIGHTWKCW